MIITPLIVSHFLYCPHVILNGLVVTIIQTFTPLFCGLLTNEPRHPPSLIRVFALRIKKPSILSYPLSAQRRLWSDWTDAQADLSLRWVHTHFVGFIMSWLKFDYPYFRAVTVERCLVSISSEEPACMTLCFFFRQRRLSHIRCQGDSFFPADGHQVILNKMNTKSKTNIKRTTIDN